MHIYHALINAPSTHMIHINLNMIFYTHVQHSPSKNPHKAPYGLTNNRPPKQQQQQQQPTMNSNVYKTNLYHTSYMRG